MEEFSNLMLERPFPSTCQYNI